MGRELLVLPMLFTIALAAGAARADELLIAIGKLVSGLAEEAPGQMERDNLVAFSGARNPRAPVTGTLTRFAAGDRCRAERTGLVQFPSEWAGLTQESFDFRSVTGFRYLADATDFGDDTKRDTTLKRGDPNVRAIVLRGKDLRCIRTLRVEPGQQRLNAACDDEMLVDALTPERRAAAFKALGVVRAACNLPPE